MREGLERAAARINALAGQGDGRGVELLAHVAGDGEVGIERQIGQMRALVMAGVALFIVQPTDNAALAQALREANDAGIPVVAYDQYIRGGRLAAYVTSNNYQAGYLGGEYAASLFPDAATIRVALVEYPHVSSTVERVNGFLDAIEAQGRAYRVVGNYRAVEPLGGRAAGAAILRDFPAPGALDVVFTVNDGGGLEVARALDETGRTDLVQISVDGDPDAVARIASGQGVLRFDAAQFCGPMGEEAMRLAWEILHGREVAPQVLIPAFPVARETLSRYPGWAGPLPEPFEKPWPAREPAWQNRFIRKE
jgi:ribose transport system substrate-binding protein